MIPFWVAGCYTPGMREGISFEVSAADRERLAAGWRTAAVRKSMSGGRRYPGLGRGLRHGGNHAPGRSVEALRLALAATLHGSGRRWLAAGQDPQARPGAGAKEAVAALVERTLAEPPGETTHWTSRAM